MQPMLFGVPRGSVLGLLLYVLYTALSCFTSSLAINSVCTCTPMTLKYTLVAVRLATTRPPQLPVSLYASPTSTTEPTKIEVTCSRARVGSWTRSSSEMCRCYRS